MALRTPDTEETLNPGQEDYDRKFNDIAKKEQAGNFDDIAHNYDQTADPSQENANIAKAQNRETNPAGGWDTKLNAAKSLAGAGKKSLLKGKGPLMFIGGGTAFGGIGLLLLVVPAILFFHLLASLFGTFDPSATALSAVTQQMILSKLGANDATAGKCGLVSIACRFKTPSNQLLQELKENGITAYDANGDEIKINLNEKWPETKVKFLSVGEGGEKIAASDLRNALQTSTDFRVAFNKIVKNVGVRAFSRFSPAFLKVISKFKLNLRDPLGTQERAGQAGQETVDDLLKDAAELKDADGAVVEGEEKAGSLITQAISKRISNLLTIIAKASKGSEVVLVAALGCAASQVPGEAKKAMTAIQESGIVSAGSPVVTAMSAIKAGDGDPKTATDLGNKWTQQDKNGDSALTAAGTKYALYGDKNTSTDPTYQNVTLGAFGDAINNLTIADAILNNPFSNVSCSALLSPITGPVVAAGINAAVVGSTSFVDFGTSLGLNIVLGGATTGLINQFGGNLSGLIGGAVSGSLSSATQPALDKLTQPGQTFGNVVSSAVGALSENNGAQTFGTAMTTDELSAYTKQTQSQQLADAEVDRATLSPFDATSQYTFLGSIVDQLMPYYSSFSSIEGGLSVFGSLLPIAFGSVLNLSSVGAASDTTTSPYEGACPTADQQTAADGSGKVIAADIFCHPVYGINVPANWDPSATADTMANIPGAINPNTGQAIVDTSAVGQTLQDITAPVQTDPSYGDWLSTCSDPENAAQCTGDDDTQKTYALYTAAQTVNAMLDMDPTDSSSNTVSSTSAYNSDLNDSSSLASAQTPVSNPIQDIADFISLLQPANSNNTPKTTAFVDSVLNSTALTQPLTSYALWG